MHSSRLCAVLIDCKTADVDAAADFWGKALGRPVDLEHPSSRGNYPEERDSLGVMTGYPTVAGYDRLPRQCWPTRAPGRVIRVRHPGD